MSAELFDLGALGLEERDAHTLSPADAFAVEGHREVHEGPSTLVASFATEDEVRLLAEQFAPRFPTEVVVTEGDAWRDKWKEYFRTTRLGERLWIAPSWEDAPVGPDEVLVRMDPGRAFGSGIHETTQLVLRELDKRIGDQEQVLDVGAGSGILSIAALKLGAKSATAIDVDPDTVSVAIENATHNGVAERFQASSATLDELPARYPFVVANIETRILVPMAEQLMSKVGLGGQLVLSGILRDEVNTIQQAYGALGSSEVTVDGEWAAVTFPEREK